MEAIGDTHNEISKVKTNKQTNKIIRKWDWSLGEEGTAERMSERKRGPEAKLVRDQGPHKG